MLGAHSGPRPVGSDEGEDESGGTAGTGSEETGDGPADDGCSAPPDAAFDPVAEFVPPDLSPTAIVTSRADDGPGSLRAVITEAPADAIIGFDAGLAGQTIALASAIELPHGLILDGTAAPGLTIDGQQQTRIFQFNGDAPTRLAFYSLRLVNGYTEGSGGAISVNGGALDLEIAGCTFEGNSAGGRPLHDSLGPARGGFGVHRQSLHG